MNIKKLAKSLNIRHNGILFIILLVGAGLMLFPSIDKKDSEAPPQTAEYYPNDEEKLEGILSEINGVGKVRVMITYCGGNESEIAYDANTEISRRGEGENTKITEERTDKQAITSSGKPFVKRTVYPEIKGAVVAAEGAANAEVRQEILDAVTTSLGLAPHKVYVGEMKHKLK